MLKSRHRAMAHAGKGCCIRQAVHRLTSRRGALAPAVNRRAELSPTAAHSQWPCFHLRVGKLCKASLHPGASRLTHADATAGADEWGVEIGLC